MYVNQGKFIPLKRRDEKNRTNSRKSDTRCQLVSEETTKCEAIAPPINIHCSSSIEVASEDHLMALPPAEWHSPITPSCTLLLAADDWKLIKSIFSGWDFWIGTVQSRLIPRVQEDHRVNGLQIIRRCRLLRLMVSNSPHLLHLLFLFLAVVVYWGPPPHSLPHKTTSEIALNGDSHWLKGISLHIRPRRRRSRRRQYVGTWRHGRAKITPSEWAAIIGTLGGRIYFGCRIINLNVTTLKCFFAWQPLLVRERQSTESDRKGDYNCIFQELLRFIHSPSPG